MSNVKRIMYIVPVRFRAVFYRTSVMSGYFSSCSSVSFPLFFSDIESHTESFLMLSLIRLYSRIKIHLFKKKNSDTVDYEPLSGRILPNEPDTYFKSV